MNFLLFTASLPVGTPGPKLHSEHVSIYANRVSQEFSGEVVSALFVEDGLGPRADDLFDGQLVAVEAKLKRKRIRWSPTRVARFFLVHDTKAGKMYQMKTKCAKRSKSIP
jgi:hypothetical protein